VRLKAGVRLTDLSPQIVLAAMIVREAYGSASCTITSANDSKHSTLSLHYKGQALDFRTKDYPGNKQALVTSIKERLGADFDVVLEALGTDNEHLHLEHDPD